ncbi:MAG: MFS transporter [Betaproteobacteria bacterium]|nr:MFS transporter [Betaproteobacteria bacterium]
MVTLYLLIALAVLTHLGFAGSRLAVPLFAVDQGGGPFVAGTIVALYAALPAVLAIPVGRAADRIGYQPLLVMGTGAIFVALLIPSIFPSVYSLYVVATVLGVGFMVFQLALQTMVGGISGPEKRAKNYSMLSLGYASANLTGPLIAGVLIDHLGHVKTFVCLAAPVLCAVVMAITGKRWIPQVKAKAQAIKAGLFDLLRDKTMRNTLIASGIVSSAWDVYQFFMPIYGRSLGMSATAIGLVVSAFAIAIILIRIVLPLFVRRVGETQTLTYAMFVACAAFCMFPFFESAWALAAVSFFLGVGCGVGQPLSMTLVYNASPRGREGEAAGMRITVNQVAHFVIPVAFGALGSLAGYAAVFLTNAGCLFAGGMLSRRLLGKK